MKGGDIMPRKDKRSRGAWKYWLMIVGGVLGVLSYIGMIWVGNNTVADVFLNIFAMLGSGVLCSAIVSIVIEHNAKKMQDEEHKKQCEFIFSTLRIDLFRIAIEELRNISEYIILRDKNEDKCWISNKMTLPEIVLKNQEYLEILSTDFDMAYQFVSCIDSEYMNNVKNRDALAYGNALTYYKILRNSLEIVLEQSHVYYLAHIFSESQISALKDLKLTTDNVIYNSNDGDFEQTFIMKKVFFMSVEECLQVFEIDTTKKVLCSYRTKKSN